MNRLQELINRELSGDRAWQHASYITQFLRAPGSSGIRKVTQYAQEKLESFGLDSVYTIEYPSKANGTEDLTFTGWDVTDARLEIVDPVHEFVVSFDEAPTCIQWWSISTPPEGVVAELIDVGTGVEESDYEGKDVRGKIVLARGDGQAEGNLQAYQLAVEQRGAIGLITDNLPYLQPPYRTRENHPEAISFLRIRTKSGKGWAFAISLTMGERLRALLRMGPVKLRAFVDAKNFPGKDIELVGEIKGSEFPNEEVWFLSHTSGIKPGGNCASGVGLWLEIARTISTLVKRRKIPRPSRTIKFLTGVEGDGLNAYLRVKGIEIANVKTAFVFCSVGNDQSEGTSLLMFKSPESIPSFVNDLCGDIIDNVSRDGLLPYKDETRDIPVIRFSVHPFSPMSDNSRLMMLKIPCPLFWCWPSRHFHTQFYTADKLDPAVLKRCGLVTAYASLRIADSSTANAREIAHIVRTRAISRFMDISRQSVQDMSVSKIENRDRWIKKIRYSLARDINAIDSIRGLTSDPKVLEELERTKRELEDRAKSEEESIESYWSHQAGGT